ncbi:MAG: imidazoleglycerol-phosphate dehydratase HisB [Atribacterota bacterium]|nr:imidazoleglycerol-phosphate dehydratase HisB [Candidatus Atribacteria bacterium]
MVLAIRETQEKRESYETQIEVFLRLEGNGEISIDMPVPFFPHLLRSMAFYARWDLTLKARGDVEVDIHHITEDTGIVLGQALRNVLDQDKQIQRFSTTFLPMDDAFSMAAVDLSGRSYLLYETPDLGDRVGDFEIPLVEEFLRALVNNTKMTLHAKIWWGKNNHHGLESLFKAIGKSLGDAAERTGHGIPSTKGLI